MAATTAKENAVGYWVSGYWRAEFEEARKIADRIGKPVKLAIERTPVVTVYVPEGEGSGTYHR